MFWSNAKAKKSSASVSNLSEATAQSSSDQTAISAVEETVTERMSEIVFGNARVLKMEIPEKRARKMLENPGWLERICKGTFYATSAGVVSGLAFALVRGRPVRVAPHYALNMAQNFLACSCAFLSAKELARFLRQRDGIVNDVVAGSATGAAIWALYRGRSGMPTGFLLGGVVAAIGSVTVSEELAKAFEAFELPGWFPVRRISEDEQREIEEEKVLQNRMRRVMMGEGDEQEAAMLKAEFLMRAAHRKERERDRRPK
mgnify:FL=1